MSAIWLGIVRRFATWLLLLGSITLVTLLLMTFAGVFHEKVKSGGIQSQRQLPADSIVVDVIQVVQPRYETAIGAIKPVHEANVASKILARVLEVNVVAGQKVNAGDVLVRLSDEELQTRVQQAEADLDSREALYQLAKVDFERSKQLISSRSISQAEYEATLAALQTAEANVNRSQRSLEESKVYLSFATIVAPFTGIVVDKAVQPGDTVSPGQTLLSVYDPSQMQLVANVRESLAMKLRVGQQLPAKLESLGYECYATVSEVVPKANVSSRSFEVKVSGPCPPGVYIGMFGRLMLPLDDEKILLIPSSAVQRVGQLTMVDVVKDDVLQRRSIQLGRSFGANVEVLSGVKEGERVLSSSPNGSGDAK